MSTVTCGSLTYSAPSCERISACSWFVVLPRARDVADQRHRNFSRLIDDVKSRQVGLAIDENAQPVAGIEPVGAFGLGRYHGRRPAIWSASAPDTLGRPLPAPGDSPAVDDVTSLVIAKSALVMCSRSGAHAPNKSDRAQAGTRIRRTDIGKRFPSREDHAGTLASQS